MRTSRLLLCIFLLFFSCDSENLYHSLTVINGSGSGDYALGEEITIAAAPPANPGEAFFQWTGDTTHLQASRSPTTVCTMPFQDIQVEAVYKVLPTYALTVVNGTGTGSYIAGTKVLITAVAPDNDEQFVRWTGDTLYVADTDTFTTFVLMPESNIRVVADFEVVREVSFVRDVFPLIQTTCAKATCHGKNEFDPTLTNYAEISRNAMDIRRVVLDGSMPYDRRLSNYEISLILRWIDAGAKNN